MEKVIKDDCVAVLYSPGFGAGWYSWNRDQPEILFDPVIVQLVQQEKFDQLLSYVTIKYPDMYTGGIDDLTVAWVPQGTLFRINEYDGSESIELKESNDWIIA